MKLFASIMAAVLCLTACTAQTSQKTETSQDVGKKVLVAYYSATGTTKAKAEAMAEATGATLYEITPAEIYTDADLDWRDKQSRSSVEMRDENSRPAIAGEEINPSEYDVIFIGFPIWWDLCPRVVNTWIESHDFGAKKVIPFATSGGSTLMNSENILRKLYPGINWEEGKLLNDTNESAAEWAKSVVE